MDFVFTLLGGLGLFLFGMRHMGDGLRKLSAHRLRRLLEVLTSNRLMGVLVGALVTAVIQSSSATTVMVVGFVNAGLMTLSQAIGVIMGANIGTTMTAHLIAFDIGELALPIVAVGAVPYLFGRKKWQRYLGEELVGFGILFIGLETMKAAMKPIGQTQMFTDLTLTLSNNWLYGIFGGAAMTAVLQSSSATIGILQELAAEGLLELKVALPVLFGDNIGTTVTALLSSIGTSLTARRAAISHFLFNVFGTVLFILALPWAAGFIELTAESVSRQIANAHTLFNVSNTLIQLPFAGLIAYAAVRIIPGKGKQREQALHLDNVFWQPPSVALQQARNEVLRMGQMGVEMLRLGRDNIERKDEAALDRMLELENQIDEFEEGITRYLVEVSKQNLSDEESGQHQQLYHLINDIERVGDHGENIQELLSHKFAAGCKFSEHAVQELIDFFDFVLETFKRALAVIEKGDVEIAREVITRENKIDEMEKTLRKSHIERLNSGLCAPTSGVVFLDIIANLERIGDHAANIADSLLGEHLH